MANDMTNKSFPTFLSGKAEKRHQSHQEDIEHHQFKKSKTADSSFLFHQSTIPEEEIIRFEHNYPHSFADEVRELLYQKRILEMEKKLAEISTKDEMMALNFQWSEFCQYTSRESLSIISKKEASRLENSVLLKINEEGYDCEFKPFFFEKK